MVGAIIGGVLSLGGAAIGGATSAAAAKRAAGITARQQAKNRAWYDYNMATDYTQRADALASINRAREIFMERNKNAAATAAVTGASDEAAARAKEDANKVIADTMSNIAAQGAAHKDAVEERYMERDAQLAEQQRQTEIAKANAIAGAASQVSKAGASLAAADATGVNAGQNASANGSKDVPETFAENPYMKNALEKAAEQAASNVLGNKIKINK